MTTRVHTSYTWRIYQELWYKQQNPAHDKDALKYQGIPTTRRSHFLWFPISVSQASHNCLVWQLPRYLPQPLSILNCHQHIWVDSWTVTHDDVITQYDQITKDDQLYIHVVRHTYYSNVIDYHTSSSLHLGISIHTLWLCSRQVVALCAQLALVQCTYPHRTCICHHVVFSK